MFPLSFCCCCWIRDSGSGIDKNQDAGLKIPDPYLWIIPVPNCSLTDNAHAEITASKGSSLL
jgi:hypothetical protein